MKDKQAKYPQLRFKGFTDPWEERKAKHLFVPVIEKGRPELPVLSVTQDRGLVYRDQVGIDIKFNRSTLSSYKVVHVNDFVISLRSFQGGFELSDKLGITSPAYTIFVPKEVDSQDNQYWAKQFKTFRFIESLKTVTFGIRDGKSISFKEFGDLKFLYPCSKNEQHQIGKLFETLDNLIAVNQRKLAKLKELKQGYLQKLFPENGSKFPQLRFSGFADAWEQRKLGDYYEFKNGLNKGKEAFGSGSPIVNFVDVFHNRRLTPNMLSGRVNLTDKEILNFEVQGGDLFFTRTSETIDEIGFPSVMDGSPKATTFSGFVLRGRAISMDPLITSFKAHVFFTDAFRVEMKKKSSMTTRALTSGSALKKMFFNFPAQQDEQQKIGTFFQQLDDLITLHQRKLEKLQELKKGYLQKMFC